MTLYKRFSLLVILIAILSFIASLVFAETLWLKSLVYLIVFSFFYTILIAAPYKLQERFHLFRKYTNWVKKDGTIFDKKK